MTLQEAFMERNDLKKKINRVNMELNTVIVTEEGEDPQFDPQKKLDELVRLQEELLFLNVRIDKANIVNSEKLHELRNLDALITHFSNLRQILLSWKRRQTLGYGDTVIQMKKNFDLAEITTKLETLETKRRDLDRELQKSNWKIEVK